MSNTGDRKRKPAARCVSLGVVGECRNYKIEFMKTFGGTPGAKERVYKCHREILVGSDDVPVLIMDTEGKEQLITTVEGVIIMYDFSSALSRNSIETFHAYVKALTAPTVPPFFIVGVGPQSSRVVPLEDANSIANRLGCTYLEISDIFLPIEVDGVIIRFVQDILKTIVKDTQATPRVPIEFAPNMGAGGGGMLTTMSTRLNSMSPRGKVAFELLSTERSYCSMMQSTIKNYLEPLRRGEVPLFDPHNIPLIFFNIEQLVAANLKFQHDLEEHLFGLHFNEIEPMCPMFRNLLPALDLYPEYVKNHWTAIETVTKKCQQPPVIAFLQKAKDLSESKLDLLSCLIQPVQRVPRYKLLLADILKNTAPEHPDYQHLDALVQRVSAVAFNVNEDMEKQEKFKTLLLIAKSFVGNFVDIVERGRVLIKDGSLERYLRTGQHKKRWFFLFNDCLIYAKILHIPGITSEVYNGSSFTQPRILKNFSATEFCTLPDGSVNPAAFQIAAAQKSFMVLAETASEKTSWIKAISSTAAVRSDGIRAPVWMADIATTKCLLCDRPFSLTTRRHHCRKCGKVVCWNCSGGKLQLSHLSQTAVRVCNECFSQSKQSKGGEVTLGSQFFKMVTGFIPATPTAAPTPNSGTGSLPVSQPTQQKQNRLSWTNAAVRPPLRHTESAFITSPMGTKPGHSSLGPSPSAISSISAPKHSSLSPINTPTSLSAVTAASVPSNSLTTETLYLNTPPSKKLPTPPKKSTECPQACTVSSVPLSSLATVTTSHSTPVISKSSSGSAALAMPSPQSDNNPYRHFLRSRRILRVRSVPPQCDLQQENHPRQKSNQCSLQRRFSTPPQSSPSSIVTIPVPKRRASLYVPESDNKRKRDSQSAPPRLMQKEFIFTPRKLKDLEGLELQAQPQQIEQPNPQLSEQQPEPPIQHAPQPNTREWNDLIWGDGGMADFAESDDSDYCEGDVGGEEIPIADSEVKEADSAPLIYIEPTEVETAPLISLGEDFSSGPTSLQSNNAHADALTVLPVISPAQIIEELLIPTPIPAAVPPAEVLNEKSPSFELLIPTPLESNNQPDSIPTLLPAIPLSSEHTALPPPITFHSADTCAEDTLSFLTLPTNSQPILTPVITTTPGTDVPTLQPISTITALIPDEILFGPAISSPSPSLEHHPSPQTSSEQLTEHKLEAEAEPEPEPEAEAEPEPELEPEPEPRPTVDDPFTNTEEYNPQEAPTYPSDPFSTEDTTAFEEPAYQEAANDQEDPFSVPDDTTAFEEPTVDAGNEDPFADPFAEEQHNQGETIDNTASPALDTVTPLETNTANLIAW